MDQKRREEEALFRLSIIGQVVNRDLKRESARSTHQTRPHRLPPVQP